MHHNPSYLGGLAEIEPHYFKPEVPEYLQHIVSNTPLDRGDGIPTVAIPAPMPSPIMVSPIVQQPMPMSNAAVHSKAVRASRNFGAPCLPCQAKSSGRTKIGQNLAGYGADATPWWKRLGQGGLLEFLSDNPETKAKIESKLLGTTSIVACEKLGLFCPVETEQSDGSTDAGPPVGLYVTVGLMGVAIVGLGIYAVTRGK